MASSILETPDDSDSPIDVDSSDELAVTETISEDVAKAAVEEDAT